MPAEIGNLINLRQLSLINNKLTSLPVELLNIKNNIIINATSYDINNLDIDCKILLFASLCSPLENLPSSLTHIWLKKQYMNLPSSLTHIWLKKQYICDVNIKLPFGCEIVYF